MAAPTVIKWNDPNVPVLKRRASALIDILDFCLPQRGWEKVFSGVDKAVYRPGSGERKFYRVLNDASFADSVYYQFAVAKVSMYDSMTDVDAGVGLTGHVYLSGPATHDTTTSRPWVLIVDEKGFFFVAIPHLDASSFVLPTALSVVQYYGETVPALPGNTARNVIAGGCSNKLSVYSNSMAFINNSSDIFVNRSIDGSRTNIKSRLQANGGQPGTSDISDPYGNSARLSLSYPYNGELLYARPMLDDALDYSMGDYIPGLYYPCQKGHTLNSFQEYSADGKTFIAFRIFGNNSSIYSAQDASLPNIAVGACLIDVSEGFRA